MSRLAITSYCLLLFFTLARAQNEFTSYNFSLIDSAAIGIEYKDDLELLAHQLTDDYSQEIEKVRSIFFWICDNISYDIEGKKDREKLTVVPSEVATKGMSVCSGYANLFHELCKLSGIKSEIVHGWAKNSYRDINNIKWDDPDHAWNAVMIDENWYLLDATWAAGNVKGSRYTKDFDNIYFCPEPEIMAINHFPKEPKWFLGASVSKEEFSSSPFCYTSYLYLLDSKNPYQNGCLEKKLFGRVSLTLPIRKEKIKSITIKGTGNHRASQYIKFEGDEESITFKFKTKKSSKHYTVYINNIGCIEYLNCD